MGLDNPLHIAFLLVLLLLVFGAKRLPEMGRSIGSGMRGFRDGLSGTGDAHPASQVTEATGALPAAPVAPVAAVTPQPVPAVAQAPRPAETATVA